MTSTLQISTSTTTVEETVKVPKVVKKKVVTHTVTFKGLPVFGSGELLAKPIKGVVYTDEDGRVRQYTPCDSIEKLHDSWLKPHYTDVLGMVALGPHPDPKNITLIPVYSVGLFLLKDKWFWDTSAEQHRKVDHYYVGRP
jgi:hypothetical protein